MSASAPLQTQWVSAKVVAASCNVSRKTIWKWRGDPKLAFPKPRVINRRVYFDQAAVEHWKKSSSREGPE
jgi:predicted DNA-binding transcriptional regulator AlpA